MAAFGACTIASKQALLRSCGDQFYMGDMRSPPLAAAGQELCDAMSFSTDGFLANKLPWDVDALPDDCSDAADNGFYGDDGLYGFIEKLHSDDAPVSCDPITGAREWPSCAEQPALVPAGHHDLQKDPGPLTPPLQQQFATAASPTVAHSPCHGLSSSVYTELVSSLDLPQNLSVQIGSANCYADYYDGTPSDYIQNGDANCYTATASVHFQQEARQQEQQQLLYSPGTMGIPAGPAGMKGGPCASMPQNALALAAYPPGAEYSLPGTPQSDLIPYLSTPSAAQSVQPMLPQSIGEQHMGPLMVPTQIPDPQISWRPLPKAISGTGPQIAWAAPPNASIPCYDIGLLPAASASTRDAALAPSPASVPVKTVVVPHRGTPRKRASGPAGAAIMAAARPKKRSRAAAAGLRATSQTAPSSSLRHAQRMAELSWRNLMLVFPGIEGEPFGMPKVDAGMSVGPVAGAAAAVDPRLSYGGILRGDGKQGEVDFM